MATPKELIEEYVKMRVELDAKRSEYNAFEKASKERMLEIETEMLDVMHDLDLESIKSDAGTAFRTNKTYARLGAGDDAKELRNQYALESGDFGLFTSHVNKTHAKELLDEGVDLASIGIDWITEHTVQFRKPTSE